MPHQSDPDTLALLAAILDSGPIGGESLDEIDCLEATETIDELLACYSVGTLHAALGHHLVTRIDDDPLAVLAFIRVLIQALSTDPNPNG